MACLIMQTPKPILKLCQPRGMVAPCGCHIHTWQLPLGQNHNQRCLGQVGSSNDAIPRQDIQKGKTSDPTYRSLLCISIIGIFKSCTQSLKEGKLQNFQRTQKRTYLFVLLALNVTLSTTLYVLAGDLPLSSSVALGVAIFSHIGEIFLTLCIINKQKEISNKIKPLKKTLTNSVTLIYIRIPLVN